MSSIDNRCEHYPQRLYIWRLEDDQPRNLYGTCRDCKTDYSIPNEEIVRLCTVPDVPNTKQFHEMFREACALYRLNGGK